MHVAVSALYSYYNLHPFVRSDDRETCRIDALSIFSNFIKSLHALSLLLAQEREREKEIAELNDLETKLPYLRSTTNFAFMQSCVVLLIYCDNYISTTILTHKINHEIIVIHVSPSSFDIQRAKAQYC